MLAVELIKKKRNGDELSRDELTYFIQAYLSGKIADYQMSALLMAIYFKGMSKSETLALTEVMLHSGEVIQHDDPSQFYVDKHSTGGVGDKTSLILAPVVSSLGIPVPMISGRGLGHTGGTLDKLESIPGFNTQLSLNEFHALMKKIKVCLIGQTPNICPADKKIYALRDVTGTVESLPLICASIMSKKLAEGINGLVLDVKFGSGAFMKSLEEARTLANGLMDIAKGANIKVTALLTNMNQPLGTYAGNSLEVQECVEIMQGDLKSNSSFHNETRDLSLALSAHMVMLAQQCSYEEAFDKCKKSLESGAAFEQFERICHAQGGHLKQLPSPKFKIDIPSQKSGFISNFELEKIGWINVQIGAGRKVVTDKIMPTSGMSFHVKVGHYVKEGDLLFTLYGDDRETLNSVRDSLLKTIHFSDNRPEPTPLIQEILT
jgi:pyrimidine-nucleoside phosphorylase